MIGRVVVRAAAIAILLGGVLAAIVLVAGRDTPDQVFAQPPPFEDTVVQIVPVRGGLYMLVGAGGNITVQLGPDGILLVDTQFLTMAERDLSALRTLSSEPIDYLVNTHGHSDHIGGNAYFRNAASGLHIVAHEEALRHMQQAGFTSEWWPTELYSSSHKSLRYNGETISLLHQPAAHTSGDTIVVFESSRVLSGGDIYNGEIYPFIDRWKGGSLDGLLAGLDRLVELMTPGAGEAADALLVPGHGEIATVEEVAAYRDMVHTIAMRVEAMIAAGMTLDQVRAAQPTREFDGRYGSDSGSWTTDQFVESIYLAITER